MKKILITFVLVCSFLCLLSSCRKAKVRNPSSRTFAGLRSADVPSRVYPYSLIPGGISGAGEFQAYRAVDKVLAVHYRDIGDRLTPTTLPRAKWLYASYRVPEGIYWTKKRILVHSGEALLTDGSNLVRARCGNRLSEQPQTPVRKFEPPVVTTDLYTPGSPFVPEELPKVPPVPPGIPKLPGLPAVSPPVALPPTVPPVGQQVSSYPAPPWVAPLRPSGPPSIFVPEVDPGILTLSGLMVLLLAIAAREQRRRRKRTPAEV